MSEPTLIRTTADFLAILTDRRFSGYNVRSQGAGFVELSFPEGGAVFAWPEVWRDRGAMAPHLARARSAYSPLVLLGTDAEFAAANAETWREQAELSLSALPLGVERLVVQLRNYRAHCRVRRNAAEGEVVADRRQYELDELNAIGRALSSERNLDKLLGLILEKSRYVTGADAGSVYTVEGEGEARTLRFKISQNDSVAYDFTEFTLPVSEKSIVGRSVLGREVINIPDLYGLDTPGEGNNPWGFQHNRDFDERIGYQTRAMLTVPMIDASDQVIGVIQLINKKKRPDVLLTTPAAFDSEVVPFDARAQNLARTLASQAAISLENALLYDEIRALFEGFVRASITAIESRDPTTSGHSQRVADLTCGLAKLTDREENGAYASFHLGGEELKKIEYAALLHDFGKVGVREHVLVKAKKLYEHDLEQIRMRFDYIRKSLEAEAHRKKFHALLNAGRDEAIPVLEMLEDEHAARIRDLDEFVGFILKANEPTVLEQGGFERLAEIARRTYIDPRGVEKPYLLAHEVETLQILRGSLTTKERIEIESHVTHTYNYLCRIPWGRTFRAIADYAGAHHEKLDGTGYPRRLLSAQIPIPAKMMAISDIFDALTASDRPYKRAVPWEKALDIIGSEVKQGKLDPELFRIFVDGKVWQAVIKQ